MPARTVRRRARTIYTALSKFPQFAELYMIQGQIYRMQKNFPQCVYRTWQSTSLFLLVLLMQAVLTLAHVQSTNSGAGMSFSISGSYSLSWKGSQSKRFASDSVRQHARDQVRRHPSLPWDLGLQMHVQTSARRLLFVC
ncbi:hypothetical protein M405DRAFT_444737 [Rhizopogon salebrosus TDB-379]|nr:hypothetical protein M405DRAFT_444737 [Rhizopogon salebrosus TDB-379]